MHPCSSEGIVGPIWLVGKLRPSVRERWRQGASRAPGPVLRLSRWAHQQLRAPSSGFDLCFLPEDTYTSPDLRLGSVLPTSLLMRNLSPGGGGGLLLSGALPGLGAASVSARTWGKGGGTWGLVLPCCLPHCVSPRVSVLFAAEDPLRHPVGPPLSAQLSHPCSTRQGACSQGVLVRLWCRSFGGLGPSAASGPRHRAGTRFPEAARLLPDPGAHPQLDTAPTGSPRVQGARGCTLGQGAWG